MYYIQQTAQKYNVTSMPTFIFLKGGVKIDDVKGADVPGLTQKIKQHYVSGDDDDEEGSGVPGYVSIFGNSLTLWVKAIVGTRNTLTSVDHLKHSDSSLTLGLVGRVHQENIVRYPNE